MSQYQPQILWEITRAIVCVAAWWVLFYRLHRPPTLARRIVLLVAMPAAYAFWIFMPMSVVANSVSWAAITVVFAFICGDLRRSLFTAFFYIGMEMSIDSTRSSMIAMIFGRFFTSYSPAQYLQYNLQYLFVFAVACFYYAVMKRYRDRPKISTWLLCAIPPLILWAVLAYFVHITDITDPILLEQGINIYGPGFCFGLFGILLNLGILYLYINLEEKVKDRTLELEAQTAIAMQANRAKSDFLATMSHEIRTPLNAIIGLSEIELQGNMYGKTHDKVYDRMYDKMSDRMSGTSRNNIAQIHQSGSYLLGIINDLLDISKIEAGNVELVPAEYETTAMIGDVVNLNMVRLGSKPINFVLEINADFPRMLLGDELRVKQILNNLLSNAAKYTHEGTITLTVKKEEKVICFSVRDTGIGIRSEDMGKLFQNYTQLDTGTNRKTEGTGLGLSITKKLAEMMGGSISVESEYGKGSCFTAKIIQGIENTETIGEEAAEKLRNFRYVFDRTADAIERHWNPRRIPNGKALVADDIPANLIVLRGLLAPYGLQVDTASSGKEVIELVKHQHYDIVFMDHMMPEMDGVEAAAVLRTIEGFNTPIVSMTANALRGMKEFYLENGFDDYLSKPVSLKALDEVIKKWVRLGSGEQHTPVTDNDPIPFNMEMEEQRLDMLNHFRAAFVSGQEIDEEYCKRFIALIESLDIFRSSPNSDPQSLLREQALLLKEAGQRGDAQKIRETLPGFYAALRQQRESREKGQGDECLLTILPRLKEAILAGATEKTEAIMNELGATNLTSAGRELYFQIYDLLLAGETEKAIEVIEGAL